MRAVRAPLGVGLFVLWASAVGAGDLPRIDVGVVVDGPWRGNPVMRELTRREVSVLTAGEFDVRFADEHYRIGDWTLETAHAHLDQLLADPEVDLVITWGVIASHAVCCSDRLLKPVVAPVVIDRELQSLPWADGASGVANLSYVAIPTQLASELAYFRRLVPFDRVAVLANPGILDAVEGLERRTEALGREVGIEIRLVAAEGSPEEIADAVPERTEAVYAWPLFHLSEAERNDLIALLNARRLPTFTALDDGEVEAGMLASLASAEFLPRLARRVALNVQRILLGEEPGSIPVAFAMRERLQINMATARRIGVSPPWEVLLEAEQVDARPEGVVEETLEGSVRRAVEANLDLATERRSVAAGAQEVARSRSRLLPGVDAAGTGLAIDEDRAAASLGSQPQRSLAASVVLSQLLYSDAALADLEVQRRLQESREAELERLRLDIALEAAVIYLDLLRAKSLVEVERTNLEVTRSNLELARIRRTIGAANPAEVYRWQSQAATDRKALIDATALRDVAEIALNRLLHRDPGRVFATRDVGLDGDLMVAHERFAGLTETPRRFRAFTDFVVETGLAASPELAALDALVAAQERALLAARRAYWAPTLGLEAAFERLLAEGGAGTGSPTLLPGVDLPGADDDAWSVAVAARLPLFAGGARAAERLAAEEELAGLRQRRAATAERVEQRIRTALTRTRASFPGIALSEVAAEAAQRNLELVADAYARGAVSIIDLLDAQAAARNADEQATNAVYDFLVDLMEAERAADRFDFFLTPEAEEAWFDAAEEFFRRRGIPPLEP